MTAANSPAIDAERLTKIHAAADQILVSYVVISNMCPALFSNRRDLRDTYEKLTQSVYKSGASARSVRLLATPETVHNYADYFSAAVDLGLKTLQTVQGGSSPKDSDKVGSNLDRFFTDFPGLFVAFNELNNAVNALAEYFPPTPIEARGARR